MSPTGVIHYVRDERALKELACSDKRLHEDLRKLDVGLRVERKDAKELPRHKQHWQLVHGASFWLERVDTGELLHIIGGDGSTSAGYHVLTCSTSAG